jgi:hypothetical protein
MINSASIENDYRVSAERSRITSTNLPTRDTTMFTGVWVVARLNVYGGQTRDESFLKYKQQLGSFQMDAAAYRMIVRVVDAGCLRV